MAESFGNSFTVVAVTADNVSADGPEQRIWIAFAKPSQASTLVLTAVPEGWTAEVVDTELTDQQRRTFEELNVKLGDVYRLRKYACCIAATYSTLTPFALSLFAALSWSAM
jgi:hypothetical protein